MHSKCDNTEIMINDKTDEVGEKHFKSFRNRYENNLATLMKDFRLSLIMLIYCIINAIK